MEEYYTQKKVISNVLSVEKLSLTTPDLRQITGSKSVAIAKWMMAWLDEYLQSGKIKVGELLPSKSEFAYFLGVSVGTIQNALRYIEDLGYVESKQKIGTMVRDKNNPVQTVKKLTSKRDKTIAEIKKFIISNKLHKGSVLPSSRALATLINSSVNTTRLALEHLCAVNILSPVSSDSSDSGLQVISLDFQKDMDKSDIEQKTLVIKIEDEIKSYINDNLSIGKRMPAHNELAKKFNVSIKTVHDALKTLIDDGILLARRGRYGTTVIRLPKDNNEYKKLEKSIFAPAKDPAFYYYEKTQNAIKTMIAQNYEIGSKLPSIMELSKEMDLSPNTIRKAFQNLAKEGYLAFSRGRYGGTFVLDIPSTGEETFKWLAVNPQYAKVYEN